MPVRTLLAIAEDEPDARWLELYERLWPYYEKWFLRDGEKARPKYAECISALRRRMPELVPMFERQVDLAGGDDHFARFLTLYCPPPYRAGCSQVAWTRGSPALVRNYDYSPDLWEAVVLASRWPHGGTGGAAVLGMTDCLWGLLDGINEAGLAVSLAFGGRRVVGRGFGMPLILRYVLELCENVREAVRELRRIPCHMAYNVSLVDPSGDFATVQMSPDREALVIRDRVATNHQFRGAQAVDWPEHTRATRSVEREEQLRRGLATATERSDDVVDWFLQEPLYCADFDRARGTLYTAHYRCEERAVDYHWRSARMEQRLGRFQDAELEIELESPARGDAEEREAAS